jgi:hypothetical protein
VDLPEAFYRPYYEPVKRPAKKQKATSGLRRGGVGDLLSEWEPPQSDVATFWEIYHDLDGITDTPRLSQIKSEVMAAATKHGLTVKGDLDKSIFTFIEMGACPWSHEMCPCPDLVEDGRCKKRMLVSG